MIKVDAMYNLYVHSIETKIKRNTIRIDELNKKVEEYLPQLSEVKETISKYVDYSDVVNGLVREIPITIDNQNDNSVRYINVLIKHFYELRAPMHILAEENKLLSTKKITIKVYKEIIKKANNKIGDYLIKTGKEYAHPYLGTFQVLHDEVVNKPNWKVSNENKKAILERGGIPYSKEDEDRCIAAGIPYFGEKWLDKSRPGGLIVLVWRSSSFMKERLREDKGTKFKGNKSRFGIIQKFSEYYLTNGGYDQFLKFKKHESKK